MRALVTGGAGFIGHHLIEYIFRNSDWEVVCLDRLDMSGDLNRVNEILDNNEWRKRFKFVFHDLKAEINPHVAYEIGDINIVFHLAASSHVDRSIENPLLFVQDNMIGACNLFNFCRTLDNVQYIQNFSTDEVYGNCFEGQLPYKETSPYECRNPYSAAKAGAQQLAQAFHYSYGLPIINTNCMNVIGERQNKEKFFPMCIKKILNNEQIIIHSYPDRNKAGSRFYIYAQNVADLSMWLVNHAMMGDTYNMVGQIELSNLELARHIAKVIDKPLDYKMVDWHSSRPAHDLRYALDGTKIESMGYSYPLEFWGSFEHTVDWTLENQRWLQ